MAFTVNGSVPAPTLRWKEGDVVTLRVANSLDEIASIHWHGILLPANMDGVPGLSFHGIGPGDAYVYRFKVRQGGTYWYHSHSGFQEQLGLYGPLIIEERAPIQVDRDVTWVLSDWRMTPSGAIRDDFGNRHDEAHDGRVGNTVTINGQVPDTFAVRTGERIRLRLINAANANLAGG